VGLGEWEGDWVRWGKVLRVASEILEERQSYLANVASSDENWELGGGGWSI
jgi:hypothetical protein